MIRLEIAAQTAKQLENEFQVLRNTANALALPWPSSLESLLAHMSIDLSYLQAELRSMGVNG